MKYNTLTTKNTTINHYQTKQFKSNKIRVSFIAPLKEETATLRAIIPYMMKAGTTLYQQRSDVSKRLQEMYSAKFNIGVSKKGEAHVIVFDISIIDDQYTLFNESLFKEAVDFLKEIIYNPLLTEDTFTEEYRLMTEYYESIYASKMRYTVQELQQIMFKDEVYKVEPLGSLEQLQHISYNDIYEGYKNMLEQDQVIITYVGNGSEHEVTKVLLDSFIPHSNHIKVSLMDCDTKDVQDVTYHEIIQDVQQAKLVMGYRFPVYYKEADYYQGLIFEMLFGGSSESLLFKTLREELGLVYSVQSSYNPYKGVFFIYAGINKESYEQVLQTIAQLLEQIQQKNIDPMLLDIAKKQYINSLIQSYDSIGGLAYKIEHSSMYQIPLDKEKTIEAVQRVTIDDLSSMVVKLTLDTICFLKGDHHE